MDARVGWWREEGGGGKSCVSNAQIYGVTLIKVLRNSERVHVTLINSQPVEHDVFVLIN